MDTVAATGFAAGADAYRDARPSWPTEAVDAAFEYWRLEPAGGLVVDLAAGTGRLTAQLAKRCPHLVAVEPVAEIEDDEQKRLRAALRDIVAPHIYHPKGKDQFTRDPRDERDWQTGRGWEMFEPLEYRAFFHERDTTRADVVGLIGSWSFIGALDEPTRADVLRRVEQLLAESGVEKYVQRWRCDLYLTRRR
ncbi:MAG: hypothetical protein E6G56_14640 [Actinobacteria bacterium]|nr:MAG: hypothetical protein E6G56_14640 [Actinomycetota bacterium]